MSLSTNPDDKPIPAKKDKNPHNYRKVGYSMIIISVSLTIIGILSVELASDYHFSSNIMALQEVDTMTPSSGYNIVLFDTSQPVGAKLKMLDHADTFDAAQQLQSQDAAQNPGSSIQVLIFNGSKDYNLNQMAGAEVFVQTPKTGYNVVFDSYDLAVGAKLTSGSYEASMANATAYEKQAQIQIQGLDEKLLIFTPSFTGNLMMVTNSSTPVTNYTLVLPPSLASSTPQTSTNQTSSNQTSTNKTTTVASPSSSNATSAPPLQVSSNKTTTAATNQTTTAATNQTTTAATNQTTTVATNKTAVTSTNQTVAVATNKTAVTSANQTMVMPNTSNATSVVANKTTGMSSNQTSPMSSKTMNATTSQIVVNATMTTGVSKLINLNETVSLNVTGK